MLLAPRITQLMASLSQYTRTLLYKTPLTVPIKLPGVLSFLSISFAHQTPNNELTSTKKPPIKWAIST
jgi:hypothetical protein